MKNKVKIGWKSDVFHNKKNYSVDSGGGGSLYIHIKQYQFCFIFISLPRTYTLTQLPSFDWFIYTGDACFMQHNNR